VCEREREKGRKSKKGGTRESRKMIKRRRKEGEKGGKGEK
jgi:hypothetical protein